jgi:RHS repeat-associated protein
MIRVLMTLIYCLFVVPAFSYDEEAKEEIFLSTPEQVAALSSEPGFLVGGIVSPLSGSPTLRQTDFVVKGAQELVLSRTYISPHMPVKLGNEKYCKDAWEKYHLYEHVAHNYKGWQFYPHLKLQFTPSEKKVLVTEPTGSTLSFVFTDSGMTNAEFEGELYGISNCAGDTPGGANDPRNTRITYGKDGQEITVYGTDKGTRIYRFSGRDTSSAKLYLLEKEILPNGKVIKYHYEGTQPTYVESLDPNERFVYASIRISGDPWLSRKISFLSSSGQTANYEYERREYDVDSEEVTKKRWLLKNDTQSLRYQVLCPPILTKVSSPTFRKERISHCGRFLLGAYEGKDRQFQIVNRGYGEGSGHYRAHQLSLPVGESDAFACVYEMSYQPPVAGEKGGKTTVKASDGTSIIYHFSKNLLTSKIQYFDENSTLKKEKIFSWDDKNWLKSLELRDGQKSLFYKKSFEYDSFGNPILETFTGDLAGSGEMESTWTKRAFSTDGKNLLLREEKENGKVTSLSYLKGTNLITSKLIKDGNRIIRREFWTYDDCHNLIEKISDDGKSESPDDLNGVTERHKISYILRGSAPFLHMPEWVIETYLDSGDEKLLKKSHLIYDTCGNVIQEEVYDAEGNFAYTIEKTYTERGDLLSETNRLGQVATYAYDEKGRKVAETNFSGRVQKRYAYDANGRLRNILEEGDDGNCRSISSKYDHHDRLIKKKDLFGNSTFYKYDLLVNEIAQTEFPKIAALDGGSQDVRISSTFDPFGREAAHTDANGNTINYSYNVYGSISEIRHPNGGRETFLYAKNGDLLSHTDADGLTINCENDVLGRVLKKTYISKEGEALAEERFTYSGFQLLSETDKEGNLKRYFYDGAGRKVREEFCGRVTEFTYDPLGRLSTVYKYNGDDALVTHYERDLEDRITCETKTDLSGRILYKIAFSYDADGNRESTTRYINEKEAQELFAYDPFRRKTYYRDALGYETLTSYNESFTNGLGQKVLQIKTTDPKGITTVKTQDALNQKVRLEKLGASGGVVSCSEMIYDPHGNLTLHKDHIYEDGRFVSTQAVRYFYTPDHEIKVMIRGYDTPEKRETQYAYSPMGRMTRKYLPDGDSLFYSYDSLGFLARVDSLNGEIAHSFTRNRLGDLLEAVDEKQNLKIKREVDLFGNVICEVLPHGVQITKTYDDFNRLQSLNVVGHAQVRYAYDSMFLREIKRLSARGDTLYKHTYDEYDLNGNLVQESLIGNLGTVSYATDVRGQRTQMISPYFSQEYKYDSTHNLVSSTTDRAESRYQYDDTSQMIREDGAGVNAAYGNDSLYNRIEKNGASCEINSLNELLFDGKTTYEYDLRGNQILKDMNSKQFSFGYDPLNQLIEVKSEKEKVEFIYDPLGRRLAKVISTKAGYGWEESTREYYLYDGEEEIGSFKSPNTLDSFRVLSTHSLPKTLSSEVGGKIFAPLIDVQGNIRRLVDVNSKTLAASYDFTAFGEKLQPKDKEDLHNPWQFASKRFDPSLDLVYFGKRYYAPKIGRWITTDPAGLEDSFNPYQYVLNNPFRYYDPNGESLEGWLLGVGEIAAGVAIIGGGLAVEVASFGGFTIGLGVTTKTGFALIGLGLATTTYHAQDLSMPWKTDFPSTTQQEYRTNGIITIPVPEGYGNITRIEKKRSSRPEPDVRAEGNPHTIIERPGPEGQYTTHNGDGTFKQYRGSGKPHGNIPRPNVKETQNNPSPSGPRPGKPEVRRPTPDEIPKG